MFNAPLPQPDHAERACRAVQAMLGELPELNERWGKKVGTTLALGVGVNTGEALVGNTGSRQRLKYGPLGNTVNVASRVEGATKHLGVPVMITGSTRALIGDAFPTRRLCSARVVGIDTPVELHELQCGDPTEEWLATREAYERALAHFEKREWADAFGALAPVLRGRRQQFDHPALTLAGRVIKCLRSPDVEHDTVLDLLEK
jgi:adenylate cyclase